MALKSPRILALCRATKAGVNMTPLLYWSISPWISFPRRLDNSWHKLDNKDLSYFFFNIENNKSQHIKRAKVIKDCIEESVIYIKTNMTLMYHKVSPLINTGTYKLAALTSVKKSPGRSWLLHSSAMLIRPASCSLSFNSSAKWSRYVLQTTSEHLKSHFSLHLTFQFSNPSPTPLTFPFYVGACLQNIIV